GDGRRPSRRVVARAGGGSAGFVVARGRRGHAVGGQWRRGRCAARVAAFRDSAGCRVATGEDRPGRHRPSSAGRAARRQGTRLRLRHGPGGADRAVVRRRGGRGRRRVARAPGGQPHRAAAPGGQRAAYGGRERQLGQGGDVRDVVRGRLRAAFHGGQPARCRMAPFGGASRPGRSALRPCARRSGAPAVLIPLRLGRYARHQRPLEYTPVFDTLSDRLTSVLQNLRSRGKLTDADIDATAREIRIALLEADVALPVVRTFISRIKERAKGAEVHQALNPAQQVIKIVNEELVAILGGETRRLNLAKNPPTVIMLAGLQGSGKTTLAGKLAMWLRKQGHSPLLVACDLQRPNAVTQLQVVGERAGV